jgi:hypothetical protein
MAFMIKQGSRNDYNYKEFIVDNDADVENIPTKGCCPGSIVFVINTAKVFMLSETKEWKEV